MDSALCELRQQRDRAARDALEVSSWKCSRSSVAWAISAMMANSRQSTTALGWLLRQIGDLADQTQEGEAMEKVLGLSFAIAALARADAMQNLVVPFPSQPLGATREVESARPMP